MKNFIKIALLWLLMLTLPLQSVVATSMLFCKMNPVALISTPMADGEMPCHIKAVSNEDKHPFSKHDPNRHEKCKICPICSSSFSLSPSIAIHFISSLVAHHEQIAFLSTDFKTHIPESLDRPPLSISSPSIASFTSV